MKTDSTSPAESMSELYVPNVHTMPNGLQVIAVQRPYSKLFAASLIYRTGSFNDPSGLPGTAHFAEHLAFAGPNKELAARLAGFGAKVNGSTGYDYTEFEVVGHIDELELALGFFANILRNRIVTDDDIASAMCSSTNSKIATTPALEKPNMTRFGEEL